MALTAPLRLWQQLARLGLGSRRQVCQLIASGQLLVNGQTATPLQWFDPSQQLMLNGVLLPQRPALHYWLLHKAVGIDCNVQLSKPNSIAHLLAELPVKLSPVGRLDQDSSGLLVLTNDGQLSQQLMHPDFCHQKIYQLILDKTVTEQQIQQLQQGPAYQVGHKQYQPKPCLVRRLAENKLEICLTQGMHRQLRYMCRAVGLKVMALHRIQLNQLKLGELALGACRPLTSAELVLLQQPSNLVSIPAQSPAAV